MFYWAAIWRIIYLFTIILYWQQQLMYDHQGSNNEFVSLLF